MMDLIPALEDEDLEKAGNVIWEIDFRGSKRAEVEHIAYERQKELTDRAIKLADLGKPKSNWELQGVLGSATFLLERLAGE